LFVNDMVMWPTAFLSDHFQWEPIDARSARARVNLHGRQFSAVLHFNDIGEWSTLSPRIDISWSAKGTSEPSGQHHCGIIVRQTGCVILPKVTPSGICREVSSHIYKPQLARLATARSTSTNSHHAILQEQSEEVPLDGQWDSGANGFAVYGALWAVAAVGFAVAAVALIARWGWWQPVMIGVTFFSLVLTAHEREVACAGVIINIIILAVVWVGPRLVYWFAR
jgi:hypothetical protein